MIVLFSIHLICTSNTNAPSMLGEVQTTMGKLGYGGIACWLS